MKWTQEEAVDFETVREVITSLMAIQTYEISEERRKVPTDQGRIEELRAYRSQLASERANMHINEPDKIARVLEEYGTVVRTWRASHTSPGPQ